MDVATVALWRRRFLIHRLAGIRDNVPRPGRKPRLPPTLADKIVEAALQPPPPPARRWTSRSLAKALGTSQSTVVRVWKARGVPKPREPKGLAPASTAPRIIRDVQGVYLTPQNKAVVLVVYDPGTRPPDSAAAPPARRGVDAAAAGAAAKRISNDLLKAVRLLYRCEPPSFALPASPPRVPPVPESRRQRGRPDPRALPPARVRRSRHGPVDLELAGSPPPDPCLREPSDLPGGYSRRRVAEGAGGAPGEAGGLRELPASRPGFQAVFRDVQAPPPALRLDQPDSGPPPQDPNPPPTGGPTGSYHSEPSALVVSSPADRRTDLPFDPPPTERGPPEAAGEEDSGADDPGGPADRV